jgi:predicted RNase H-like HicB family nuclease
MILLITRFKDSTGNNQWVSQDFKGLVTQADSFKEVLEAAIEAWEMVREDDKKSYSNWGREIAIEEVADFLSKFSGNIKSTNKIQDIPDNTIAAIVAMIDINNIEVSYLEGEV